MITFNMVRETETEQIRLDNMQLITRLDKLLIVLNIVLLILVIQIYTR